MGINIYKMAWDEGSFLEGAFAGAMSGAVVGTVVSPATAGLSIPLLSIIGAVLGALIKVRLFQAIITIGGIYLFANLGILPPYMIIILIIIFLFWIIGGMKK